MDSKRRSDAAVNPIQEYPIKLGKRARFAQSAFDTSSGKVAL